MQTASNLTTAVRDHLAANDMPTDRYLVADATRAVIWMQLGQPDQRVFRMDAHTHYGHRVPARVLVDQLNLSSLV